MNITKPYRKKHSYAQHIKANRETVFPLLCPVAEELWVPGWKPDTVITNCGVAERGCVFITPEAKNNQSIWIISKYAPVSFELEMVKVTPKRTVGHLEISLDELNNNETRVHITYEFTAIGEEGEKFLAEFTEEWYSAYMQGWEKAMNHYVMKGEMIKP